MDRLLQRAGLVRLARGLAVALGAALLAACNAPTSSTSATTASNAASPLSGSASTASALALSSANYSTAQSGGSATITVQRRGNTNKAASVQYTTQDGTAVAGTDYTAVSGSLQWAENDATTRTITVPISSSSAYTGSKTFEVILSDSQGGAALATPTIATITINGSASTGTGTPQLSSSAYGVDQGSGTLTVTVDRTGGSAGAISVAYGTSNGSAVAGTDYTASQGVLQWADGDASAKTFSVPISTLTPFSGTKTFTVALSNPASGVSLGTPSTATVTITGATSAAVGSLQFSAAGYTVAQAAGTVVLTVDRVGGSSGATSVSYQTASNTAVAGTDFTATSGKLSWAAGDTTAKQITVAISNASAFSGNKTFTVLLANPTAGATITTPNSATVTIAGAASAPVGSLQLSASTYSVSQGAGTLTVSVARTGGSSGPATVAYATANGTAAAGTDYSAASGTLSWADGDASSKTFSIAISNTTPFSGNKSFTVTLSAPGGGATLGNPSTSSVTIAGDAAAAIGSLQLSTASYSVAQSGGTVTVTVNRTGGSAGAVSVSYATASGTAMAGTDFTATSGTLSWSDGDAASKTFTVAISNATPFSGSRSFTVAISNPTNGATTTTPTSATVGIVGSSGSTFWIYYNGTFNWGGDYSFVLTPNYQDTTGAPLSGTYDIAATLTSAWGGFQPYAGGTVPLWNFNDVGYNYLTMALKPTVANQTWAIYFMLVGDIPLPSSCMVDLSSYGPTPVVGQWGVYKIPLSTLCVQNTGVYKFAIKDTTGLNNNLWYVDNLGFTTN